jgi:hypothetical protein
MNQPAACAAPLCREKTMAHSDHGIVKNKKAEEQPKDKQRAQTVQTADPDKSVSREATRDSDSDASNEAKGKLSGQ